MSKIFNFDKYVGQRVHLYRNLHHQNEGRFSIRADTEVDGEIKKRVIGYVDRAILRDVTFYVSQSTRARSLATGKNGQRTVHAWAIGYLIAQDYDLDLIPGALEIHYNYKEHSSFVVAETNEPIHRSEFFVVYDGKAFVTREIGSLYHPRQLSLFG
jgi:hypothetical protein